LNLFDIFAIASCLFREIEQTTGISYDAVEHG
jgi:hypothetical protein